MLHLLLVHLPTVEFLPPLGGVCIQKKNEYKVNGWPDGFAFFLSWLAPAWAIGLLAFLQPDGYELINGSHFPRRI